MRESHGCAKGNALCRALFAALGCFALVDHAFRFVSSSGVGWNSLRFAKELLFGSYCVDSSAMTKFLLLTQAIVFMLRTFVEKSKLSKNYCSIRIESTKQQEEKARAII